MRVLPLLCAFGLATVATVSSGFAMPVQAAGKGKTEEVLTRAVDQVIRPGYHRFLDQTAALQGAMGTLCATPSEAVETAARAAFVDTLKAWGAVEMFRTGPALEKNRFERVLYYPDRKSIGLKQVQAILAKKDETATDPAHFAAKSVGVQGLGALEYVLYGKGNEELATERNSHRCRFGAAIATNLHGIAGEFAQAWDSPNGIAASWKDPGDANPVFRTEQEAVTELLGTMVHGVELVREQRIKAFYPVGDTPANPKAALFWRSGQTWTMLAANAEGLSTFWKKAGMETLLKDDQRSIAHSILFVLKSIQRVAPTVTPDIEAAISQPDERAKVDFLLLNTKDVILRLSDDYGKALGLGAGFSFSDGD